MHCEERVWRGSIVLGLSWGWWVGMPLKRFVVGCDGNVVG
jgi:hypothetical protein